MGRSVSVPHNAVCTAYVHLEAEDEFAWEDFTDDLWHTLRSKYKSLQPDDRWVGREDKVHWSNAHADIVLAEYCGLVSVSLVPTEDTYYPYDEQGLHRAWCEQVSKGFLDLINSSFGGLRRIGSASNGEAFFQRI